MLSKDWGSSLTEVLVVLSLPEEAFVSGVFTIENGRPAINACGLRLWSAFSFIDLWRVGLYVAEKLPSVIFVRLVVGRSVKPAWVSVYGSLGAGTVRVVGEGRGDELLSVCDAKDASDGEEQKHSVRRVKQLLKIESLKTFARVYQVTKKKYACTTSLV